MIGCLNLSLQESKCRSHKRKTSSTFTDMEKAAESNQKSPVQNDSTER